MVRRVLLLDRSHSQSHGLSRQDSPASSRARVLSLSSGDRQSQRRALTAPPGVQTRTRVPACLAQWSVPLDSSEGGELQNKESQPAGCRLSL